MLYHPTGDNVEQALNFQAQIGGQMIAQAQILEQAGEVWRGVGKHPGRGGEARQVQHPKVGQQVQHPKVGQQVPDVLQAESIQDMPVSDEQ